MDALHLRFVGHQFGIVPKMPFVWMHLDDSCSGLNLGLETLRYFAPQSLNPFVAARAYTLHSRTARYESDSIEETIISTTIHNTLSSTAMHVATAEILVKPEKAALAGQYHDSLVPRLNEIPGFIREARYTSVDVPNKVLILSWWEDSAAIGRWRNQSNHLRIQEKGSKDVFQDYRLRIGPAYDVNQDSTEIVSQHRSFMVLYWRQKQDGQAFSIERRSELRDETVSRLKAVALDNAAYEGEASVLQLSGWSSQQDALLYEESVIRVEGDKMERVCVERDYTKQRRDDAPHHEPGH